MNTRKLKVGNVVVEIPETSAIPLGKSTDAPKTIAERGNEAKPTESLPPIPNPNDFVGSAMFQAHAIGRVGTSNKKWVNRTGAIIFGAIPVAVVEAVLLWAWVTSGKWYPFVIVTTVFAYILLRKGKPAAGNKDG